MSDLPVIKPKDIQLGNFIDVFGMPEIVTGIVLRDNNTFFVQHSASNQENNPFDTGIEFSTYPILLTEQWRKALNVEKYIFPEWLKYVHEAQNYIRWYAGHDLLPNVNWDIVTQIKINPQ